MTNNAMEVAVMKWRQERAERLRTDERSWFGLAGLFWLKDGENSFGSDPSCNFILPSDAPKKAGVFHYKDGQVTIKAEPTVKMSRNGERLPSRPLRDDQQDDPDFLYLSHFIFVVIIRGGSTLIRMWDVDHPARKAFSGLNFFPYRPEYCFTAKYSGYAPYKSVRTEDIIGEVHDSHIIGYAAFEWEGKTYCLDAEDGGVMSRIFTN